jgi:hypothetical protein
MNATFVMGFFYAPRLMAPQAVAAKWSPRRQAHLHLLLRQLEQGRAQKSEVLDLSSQKSRSPLYSRMGSSRSNLLTSARYLHPLEKKRERTNGHMKYVEGPGKRKLTLGEVRAAFGPLSEKYPPVLGLDLAAELSGYTASTLKKKVSEGCFHDCVARGKPLLFWRDWFVVAIFSARQLPLARPVAHDQAIDDPNGGLS